MPLLTAPIDENYLTLPPQKARLAATTDVLVVGGGPSGIGAALGARKSGVKVILVERYGFLGGNATAALVMPMMSYHNQYRFKKEGGRKKYNLFPTDHGPGKPVIKGVLENFLEMLVKNSGAIYPSQKTGYVVPFDPEIFKWTALDILDKAGVVILFHALASYVIRKKKLYQVVFQTKSGPIVIQSKILIDCTGDGDIAYLAGADYEIGRREDMLLQPMSLIFRMGQFNLDKFNNYISDNPDQWLGVRGLWKLIEKARKNGELNLHRENLLMFATTHKNEVNINSTRVTRVSGINVWDLTLAEYESRKQMHQIVSFLKKYVPGFKKSYAVQSGVQVGVRETRRIRGLYTLTQEDILSCKKFYDVIAQNAYPLDIHNPEGKGTMLKKIPLRKAYQIPLRCLIPHNIDGLITAGRCISGTHEAHSSYRIMPVSMATGQAAGVCAAIASKKNTNIRDLKYDDIKKELLKQKAKLN